MKEETEQKTLPASVKKLRDARRKGQVSRSRDIIAGATLFVTVTYLLMTWTDIRDRILQLTEIVSAAPAHGFEQTVERAAELAATILLSALLPLVGLVVAAGFIAGSIGTLGAVFSFDLVKPKPDHLNPVNGAKRIFSLRNVIEFVKSIAKVAILLAAFGLVLSGSLQALFETPACGAVCLGPVVLATARPLAATAAFAFVAIGVIDIVLQRGCSCATCG
jgi:type III secretion protein U